MDQLPVFPLSEAVLFPGVVLPLHIFEQRYRELVADTLASHRLMVLAMVNPEAARDKRPALAEVGCLARIVHAERLQGGRFDILVQGIERTRLARELPSARGYRCFRTEGVPPPSVEAIDGARAAVIRLERCAAGLGRVAEGRDAALVEILHSTADPIELADLLAAILVPQGEAQQRLLASNDLVARLDAVVEAMIDMMGRLGGPVSHSPARH